MAHTTYTLTSSLPEPLELTTLDETAYIIRRDQGTVDYVLTAVEREAGRMISSYTLTGSDLNAFIAKVKIRAVDE